VRITFNGQLDVKELMEMYVPVHELHVGTLGCVT
jgi:hypothetical protein